METTRIRAAINGDPHCHARRLQLALLGTLRKVYPQAIGSQIPVANGPKLQIGLCG